jgi:hypothetical protein
MRSALVKLIVIHRGQTRPRSRMITQGHHAILTVDPGRFGTVGKKVGETPGRVQIARFWCGWLARL